MSSEGIDLAGLSSGVYFLNVQLSDGNRLNGKFVIAK